MESGFYTYSSGIYSCPVDSATAYANINHAVELVGMDCDGNYIVKNSWDTTWGDSGFATVDKDNDCGISAFVYTVLSEFHLSYAQILLTFIVLMTLL